MPQPSNPAAAQPNALQVASEAVQSATDAVKTSAEAIKHSAETLKQNASSILPGSAANKIDAPIPLFLNDSDADLVGGRAASSERESVPWHVHAVTLVVIVLPFLAVIAAALLIKPLGFAWWHAGMLIVGYILTGLGITIGYHRLFTHKSFEAPRPVVFLLAVLGTMAVEGPLLRWVATHRRHHQHSDDVDDPHSPHTHGAGFKNMMKGLWHSHAGWVFSPPLKGLEKYVPDLMKDKMLVNLDRFSGIYLALGLLIPAAIGYAFDPSLKGACLGFLWGGLVRVFVVHHITWSINSVCHLWGRQPFESHDESRNNVVCGVLGLGEGWHNNHHAFPTSARHGLEWWQFDISYILIKGASYLGLARNIRLPSQDRLEAKRIKH